MTAKLVLLFLLGFTVVPATADVRKGEPALQGYAALTDGYLKATATRPDSLNQTLDIWMTKQGSKVPIKQYRVEMTKKLHVVIVGEDFKTFLHIHPDLQPTGHFLIAQHFPT